MASPEHDNIPQIDPEQAMESLEDIEGDIKALDEKFDEGSKQAEKKLQAIREEFDRVKASMPPSKAQDLERKLQYVQDLLSKMSSGDFNLDHDDYDERVYRMPKPTGLVGRLYLADTPRGPVINIEKTRLKVEGNMVIHFESVAGPRGTIPRELMIDGGYDSVDDSIVSGVLGKDWEKGINPANHEQVKLLAKQIYAHKAAVGGLNAVDSVMQAPNSGYYVSEYTTKSYREFLKEQISAFETRLEQVRSN